MRKIFFLIFLLLVAQYIEAQKPAFFRIYNSHGKKISKGSLFQLSDTSVTLTRKNTFTEIPVSNIKVLKSKRTTAHRIVFTTLAVASVVALVAVAINANSEHRNRNFNSTSHKHNPDLSTMGKPPKPYKKYVVNNDIETWKEQRRLLTFLLL